jgi:hypothetical protein
MPEECMAGATDGGVLSVELKKVKKYGKKANGDP